MPSGGFAPVPSSKRGQLKGKGSRGVNRAQRRSFIPPENWYEPRSEARLAARGGYQVIVQPAGEGFRHVVTAAEVRDRLAQLPAWATAPLEVIQLSRMTRKKQSFPCYGMQWGTTLYLYPVDDTLIEQFDAPPLPAQYNEARMYGGQWIDLGAGRWQLVWTPETIRDFYLNNILIHELAHLLDDRNSRSIDRERYAEWFAIEYGYKVSRRAEFAQRAAAKLVRRRHDKN